MLGGFLAAFAGACLCVGLHESVAAFFASRRYQHLAVALASVASAVFIYAGLYRFTAAKLDQLIWITKARGLAVVTATFALMWLATQVTRARWPFRAWSVLMVVLGAGSLALPEGVFYPQFTTTELHELFSGELITVAVGTPAPALLGVSAIVAWSPLPFFSVQFYRMARAGQRRLALVMAFALFPIPIAGAVLIMLPRDAASSYPLFELAALFTLVVLSLHYATEVAESIRASKELEAREAGFRDLADNTPEAVCVLDPERLVVLSANRHFVDDLVGHRLAGVSGLDLRSILPESQSDGQSSRELITSTVAKALAGEPQRIEMSLRHAEGHLVWALIRVSALPGRGPPRVRLSLLDISERKSAEGLREELAERARHSERFETLGQLAGGMAHDFSNALAPVLAFSEVAADQIPEDHPAHAHVEEIKAAALRARESVRLILRFSRPVAPTAGAIQLDAAARQAVQMLRASLPARLSVQLHVEDPIRPIIGDAIQAEQIVLGLGENAARAMLQEGSIRISLRTLEPSIEWRRSHPRFPTGEAVCLSVSDKGQGMSAKVMEHAFDPFFTTRGLGRGRGLGLSLIRAIVIGWNGAIDIESHPGQGTSVTIHIPVAAKPTGIEASA